MFVEKRDKGGLGWFGPDFDIYIWFLSFAMPVYKIPVFSLYGEVRRPTEKMFSTFDVLASKRAADWNRRGRRPRLFQSASRLLAKVSKSTSLTA